MRTAVLVLFLASAAWAALGDVPADKEFLLKQQEVLRLFTKVHEPNRFKEQRDLGAAYEPLNNLQRYKNVEPVKQLVKLYRAGKLLPRGQIFTLFEDDHREGMILLFESLLYSLDFDTFLRTAVWARDRINEGQFVYALSVAVLHREDTKGVVLPPPYEIYPHLFVNSEVIINAYKSKMRQEPKIVYSNFTGTIRNPEQRVAYLGEDLGLNSHHCHWHMDFPFWWKEEYGIPKERKGELFYYMHHQLIARFNLERLSNYLPFVEPLSFNDVIVDGFYPQTTYRVGGEFPARPDNFKFHDLENIRIQDMVDYTRRIREAISQLSVFTESGDLFPLNDTDGINILGELIEPSSKSKHRSYYGALHNYGHIMLGKITDPLGKFNLPPGVMEHFETATRDPAFFRLHKYIDNIFKEYKDRLPYYTKEELEVPGVKIDNFRIDELVTFFEYFDIDMLNSLDDSQNIQDVNIHARVKRLNHKPFTFSFDINSERDVAVTARVFLAPKYDWFGQEIPINEQREYAVEIDKFVFKLTAGKNVVTRKSTESSVTIPDRETTKVLVQRVEQALEGKSTLTVNKDFRHCGYPDRLLLPKGRVGGMPFILYVVLSDYEKDKVNDLPLDYDYGGSISYCGTLGHRYPDRRPMGFPFDRRVKPDEFFYPNIYTTDVTVTFKDVL